MQEELDSSSDEEVETDDEFDGIFYEEVVVDEGDEKETVLVPQREVSYSSTTATIIDCITWLIDS